MYDVLQNSTYHRVKKVEIINYEFLASNIVYSIFRDGEVLPVELVRFHLEPSL